MIVRLQKKYIQSFGETEHVAILGIKGLPPEFPGTSGIESYVAERIPSLVESGKKVTCYVRAWATPRTERHYLGATLVRIPSVRTKQLDAMSHTLLSTLLACVSDADTVWFHASGPALFAFLPRFVGKRVFFTLHTLEWKREKWGAVARLLLRIGEWVGVRSASACFVVSRDLARYVKETHHKKSIVDEPKEHIYAPTAPKIIRKRYNLKGKDYILYLGRFVPEKRIEWLIRAYSHVRPKGVRLVIAGGEGYGNAYEKKIKHGSVTNSDIIFVGWVFGKEKEELLGNCLLFVLPSSIEGNPMVLKEVPWHARILISDRLAKTIHTNCLAYTFHHDSETDFSKQFRRALLSV